MPNEGFRQVVGAGFAFVLFALLECVLFLRSGSSFALVLLRGSSMPILVFLAGCILGMAWEYVGQFTWRLWRYPIIDCCRPLLAVLPLFWGLFMLIMQDGYALARICGLDPLPAVLLSTIFIGVLVEGINLYTRSWAYMGLLRSYVALAAGWLIFLSLTFVLGFNAVVMSPFGY